MNDISLMCGSVEIRYTQDLDGGGSKLWQNYVIFVREYIGPVRSVLEWCAGPGFFGFSLLAHHLCQSVHFTDINPYAIKACCTTAQRNHLEDKVSFSVSDCLEDIPASESFDLVVGNPPHSGTAKLYPDWGSPLIYRDENWAIHRKFYANVHRFLNPGAHVILLENSELSSRETFREMIEQGGLKLMGVYPCPVKLEPCAETYLLWSQKRD